MEKNKWNKIEQVFIAPKGFESELLNELKDTGFLQGRLGFTNKKLSKIPVWQEQVWNNPQILEFESIKQAAEHLKSLDKNTDEKLFWVNASQDLHRRSALISEHLRIAKFKELKFLQSIPEKKIASFALLDSKCLVYSTEISNSFALGECDFIEDKETPPSRAYLKLWELFTVKNIKPASKARCLDMGSCPGGWTWVLQTVGCDVVSVDKAPLDDKIAQLPRIKFLKKDAFRLDPSEIGPIDWFFSDIICEPLRLYELVMKWMDSGNVKNFACTIKFKGKTDFQAIEKFRAVPGSEMFHLHHNKHELTWVLVRG